MSKKNYQIANEKVFDNIIKKHTKDIEKKIVITFQEVAREVLAYIELPDTTPFWTGNLQDSTGLAIYNESKLIHYFPPEKVASEPQHYYGEEIWGHVEIAKAFAEGIALFPSGMFIVLFSAVPYAVSQESQKGYFKKMTEEMESIFRQRMKQAFGLKL